MHRPRPGMPPPEPVSRLRQDHAFNAPPLQLGLFRPVMNARNLDIQSRHALHPLPCEAGGVVILDPFGSDRREPNTLAPHRGESKNPPAGPPKGSKNIWS